MSETPEVLPIIRPNGQVYRPRRLAVHPVAADPSWPDDTTAVVVFGTHDPDIAKPLADREIAVIVDPGYCAGSHRLVWWRDAMESGERRYITDEERGRAGVRFDIVERAALASASADGSGPR